jgi:hypothetical protein
MYGGMDGVQNRVRRESQETKSFRSSVVGRSNGADSVAGRAIIRGVHEL